MTRSPSGVRAEHTWVGSGAPARVALQGSERAHEKAYRTPVDGTSRESAKGVIEALTVTLGNLTEGVVRSTMPCSASRVTSVTLDRQPSLSVRDRLALKGLRAVWRSFRPHIKEARCRFRNRFAGPRPPVPAAPFSPSA